MIQELIKVNNKDEKELILNSLDKKNVKWASGEKANCERMRNVMPDEFYLFIIENELYWDTISDTEMFDDEILDKTKTVSEFIKGVDGLPNVDLTLIKVKYGEESEILDYLASLNVKWLKGQLANKWRVKKENLNYNKYYLIILNSKELTWGDVDEIDSPAWELFIDMKNIKSEERLEAEEFIERFMR
ncbi:MAG: hypothetical protein ACI3T9_02855 [Romboutsia timonensis]